MEIVVIKGASLWAAMEGVKVKMAAICYATSTFTFSLIPRDRKGEFHLKGTRFLSLPTSQGKARLYRLL